jgi:hypothetical protein
MVNEAVIPLGGQSSTISAHLMGALYCLVVEPYERNKRCTEGNDDQLIASENDRSGHNNCLLDRVLVRQLRMRLISPLQDYNEDDVDSHVEQAREYLENDNNVPGIFTDVIESIDSRPIISFLRNAIAHAGFSIKRPDGEIGDSTSPFEATLKLWNRNTSGRVLRYAEANVWDIINWAHDFDRNIAAGDDCNTCPVPPQV